jgi:hypothetical protein
MADKSKQVGKKGGKSSIMAAGAAGAVVGAAIGGVTAAALADSQTRKKVGAVAADVTEFATEVIEEAKVTEPQNVSRTVQAKAKKK